MKEGYSCRNCQAAAHFACLRAPKLDNRRPGNLPLYAAYARRLDIEPFAVYNVGNTFEFPGVGSREWVVG